MKRISRCDNCKKYTMGEICGCGSKTIIAAPIKYSPDDKFVHYRRKAKLEEYSKRGFI